MRWGQAHAIARVAAAHLHEDAETNRTEYVDVFEALEKLRIPVMHQWMPRLFGAYYSPAGDGPAVLINSGLSVATRRHTAAHELGHHALQHTSTVDDLLEEGSSWNRSGWSPAEMTAEAFAAWFLMPLPAVQKAVSRLHGSHIAGPEDVYSIALQLGTTYQGTLRHLAGLKLLGAKYGATWARTTLPRIRKNLHPAWTSVASSTSDEVWLLDEASDGEKFHAGPGDRFSVRLYCANETTLDKNALSAEGPIVILDSQLLREQTPQGASVVALLRLNENATEIATINVNYSTAEHQSAQWSVSVEPHQERQGLHAPWLFGQE